MYNKSLDKKVEVKMLIKFTVKNYLSFKKETSFDMLASKDKQFLEDNTFKFKDEYNILKSIVMYGANASGKSNLLKALRFFRSFIINSSKETQLDETIPVECFKLNNENINEPSLFEVVFFIKDNRYRYGFEVTKKKVVNEWLFVTYTNRESKLFIRKGNNFEIGDKFKEGKDLDKKTRENALFLSVNAQFNGEISKEILNWFMNIHILMNDSKPGVTIAILEDKRDKEKKKKLLNFLRYADLSVEDFKVISKEVNFEDMFKDMPFTFKFKEDFMKKNIGKKLDILSSKEVKTLHKIYQKDLKDFSFTEFDLDREESDGTQRFFYLAGPIIDTLMDGGILFIDEIESSLHPLLILEILKIINKNNLKKAQFFLTTHNVGILSSDLLRRDQILFSEKNKYGESELFSLIDFKGHRIRKDASYEKDYLLGRYGAVPYLKKIENSFIK